MVSSVSKILYLITKGPDQFSSDLLPQNLAPDEKLTVILLQDAVLLNTVSVPHAYVLHEDAAARDSSPPRQTVSYHDMLRMIFEADRVVTV